MLHLFQSQVVFLQNERKGQENMKQDLVRRIKMLEYALKQERYSSFSCPHYVVLGILVDFTSCWHFS